MSTQLFFIYDTHCPWSYAATALVSSINEAYPQIKLQLLHSGYYDGDNSVSKNTLEAVEKLSNVTFGKRYYADIDQHKDSTLCANLMTWVQNKSPHAALELLQAIQQLHFQLGSACSNENDVQDIISKLKLSPPAKSLKNNKLSKGAEATIHEIDEIQEFIGTSAIPALLLAKDENLTLLNHNFYLENPSLIVEAIQTELDK